MIIDCNNKMLAFGGTTLNTIVLLGKDSYESISKKTSLILKLQFQYSIIRHEILTTTFTDEISFFDTKMNNELNLHLHPVEILILCNDPNSS